MKKLLALILALAMLFAMTMLVGCDSKSDDDDDDDKSSKVSSEALNDNKPSKAPVAMTDEERIVGDWVASVDFSGKLNEEMQKNQEMKDYLNFKDLEIDLVFEIDEKEVKMYIDEDSVKDMFEDLKKDFKVGTLEYLEDVIKAQGVDMTVDELLAAQGMTLDELIDQSMSYDMIAAQMPKATTGEYSLKDGEFCDAEDGEGMEYSFTDDDTLVIKVDKDNSLYAFAKELVFKRK